MSSFDQQNISENWLLSADTDYLPIYTVVHLIHWTKLFGKMANNSLSWNMSYRLIYKNV